MAHTLHIQGRAAFDDHLLRRWSELAARVSVPNIFLTPEWATIWWKHNGAGSEILILTAENDDDELVGLAPLRVTVRRRPGLPSVREISFLGTDDSCPDHLQFLAVPGDEARICDALAGHIAGEVPWDLLRLTDLPADSPTRAALIRRLTGTGAQLSDNAGAVCPYIPLSCTWEELLSGRSSKTRNRIRRKRRDLDEAGGVVRRCETPAEVDRALSALFELNATRWQDRGHPSAFGRRSFQLFHRDLARRFLANGWLELGEVELDGRIVAVIYQFRYGDKMWFYNTGFAEDAAELKPGDVLNEVMIERSCELGLAEYDYLRGEYEYKNRWTDLSRVNRDIVAIAPTLRARAWHRTDTSLQAARRAAADRLPAPVRRAAARQASR